MSPRKRWLTLKSVMTPFPDSIDVNAPLSEARRFLRARRIHHLPVVDGGDLVGIVSDRDIKLVLGPDFDYPPERELTVRDAYQPHAETLDLNAPAVRALELMVDHHIGSVLVTRKGRLAGIFTCTDACRAFAQRLREEEPGPGDDAA